MDVFLQFPNNFDESKSILKSFIEIYRSSKKDNQIAMYYSKNEVKNFIADNEDSETYFTDDVKVFRQLMMSSRAFDVSKMLKDQSISYLQWNLEEYSCCPCENSLSVLAEKLYEDPNYSYAFVNFEGAIKKCRDRILVFKDAKHLNYLPNYFVNIYDVSNFLEFDYWLKTKHINEFSLRNTTRFRKHSDKIMKGAIVYFEFDADRYWHKDTFHEYIEYEVYDATGNHLATANEVGQINFSKKDPKKKNILK